MLQNTETSELKAFRFFGELFRISCVSIQKKKNSEHALRRYRSNNDLNLLEKQNCFSLPFQVLRLELRHGLDTLSYLY